MMCCPTDELSPGTDIPQLGRIAAYENRSAKLIGWMGPGGFTSGSGYALRSIRTPARGLHSASWPTLISFTDAVYRLDLGHRHIEKIFSAEAGESVIGASDSEIDGLVVSEFGERARFVAISTTERVVVQSRDGTVQLSVPHDPNAARYTTVRVYPCATGFRFADICLVHTWIGNAGFRHASGIVKHRRTVHLARSASSRVILTWGFVLIRSDYGKHHDALVIRQLASVFDDALIQLSSGQLWCRG